MTNHSLIACCLLSWILAAVGSRAGERPRPEARAFIQAVPVTQSSPIRLDGAISESLWESSSSASDFRQREPEDGAPCSYRTEARVAYDSAALYVGVKAYDPEPQKIVGLLTRRDSDSPSDWIQVIVDSYHDRRSAFEFGVNPVGVKQDKYWFNDGNDSDSGWDAVWEVQTRQDEQGWSAEFRIPLSQLRIAAGAEPVFGIAVVRKIARLGDLHRVAAGTRGVSRGLEGLPLRQELRRHLHRAGSQRLSDQSRLLVQLLTRQ